MDPGYNDDKKNDPISFIKENERKGPKKNEGKKNFISPNEAKKGKQVGPQMKGPGQSVTNKNSSQADDILGLDLMGTGNTQQSSSNNNMDLLDDGGSKPQQTQQKNISYDDLLSGMGGSNNDNDSII